MWTLQFFNDHQIVEIFSVFQKDYWKHALIHTRATDYNIKFLSFGLNYIITQDYLRFLRKSE